MAEGLQIAQILADLQTLQNADPQAAKALLSATKNPPPPPPTTSQTSTTTTTARAPLASAHSSSSSLPQLRTSHHRKSSSNNNSQYSLPLSRAGTDSHSAQARLEKIGRGKGIPRSSSNYGGQGTGTPPLSRSSSSFGQGRFGAGGNGSVSGSLAGSRSGSGYGTPVEDNQDPDLARARTLLELFEMRGKFKQMGDTGLTRSKQRVDAVVEKYAQIELEEREKEAKGKHLNA